jgi:colicin import membrane protein
VAPAATTGAAATVEATPAADASKAEATAKANAQTEKIEVHNEAKAKRAALAEQKRAAAAAKKQAALEAKKRTEAEKHHIVVPANEPAKELGLSQVNAPALPISATKQEKLAALLQQYKADQLSPEEYQTRRAAIIAEP